MAFSSFERYVAFKSKFLKLPAPEQQLAKGKMLNPADRFSQSVPSPLLFKLSSFFLPWLVLGFEYKGYALYLSFIFMILDLRFWASLLTKKHKINFAGVSLALLGIYFLLGFRAATDPKASLVKSVAAAAYIVYLALGFKAYGLKSHFLGLQAACFFAVLQFLEANIFDSRLLFPKDFIMQISNNLTLNIVGGGGHPYAQNPIFYGLTRVSGPSIEPGHFSTLLLCALGYVKLRSRTGLAIAIGLFVCLSKNALFVLPLVLGLKFAMHAFPTLLSIVPILTTGLYLLMAHLAFLHFGSLQGLADYSISLYARLEGGLAFQDFAWVNRLFGAGFQGTCDALSPEFLNDAIAPFSKSGPGSINRSYCTIGAFSGISSFILEQGLLAVLLLSLFVHQCRKFRLPWLSGYQLQNSLGVLYSNAGWYLSMFWVCLVSIHYLTFFPSLFVLPSLAVVSVSEGLRLRQLRRSETAKAAVRYSRLMPGR